VFPTDYTDGTERGAERGGQTPSNPQHVVRETRSEVSDEGLFSDRSLGWAMSEVPGRVRRAFADHGGFEKVTTGEYASTSTAFDATVAVGEEEAGHVPFTVEMQVPSLSAVVDGDVAGVVEDGWYETFELRVRDASGVTRGDHDLEPAVRQAGDSVVVTAEYTDINERRGVDDAAAFVTFVEGTFVEGVIPGYDYTEPVSSLLSSAREMSGF
jgi:hypothetical protein